MNKVDVIILSLVKDDKSFDITQRCIDSYISTADELINKIVVVETNSEFDGDYKNEKVSLIKPNKPFNYNQFYNIGLDECTADYIMGPNSDIIIQENCIQTIVKEFESNPDIDSISPIDRSFERQRRNIFPSENKLYYGYNVPMHVFGCCFCARRKVFETMGYLDESFDFFYQDNDYAMSLERCNLKHGIHTGAKIIHKSGGTNRIADVKFQYNQHNMSRYDTLFFKKWLHTEPFKSGGYKKFKSFK